MKIRRKSTVVEAIRVERHERVDTVAGLADVGPGDWLVKDTNGTVRLVNAKEFDTDYEILPTEEMQYQERRRLVAVVKLGTKSEFWKVMKKEITSLKEHEEKFLDSYKTSILRPEDVPLFNKTSGWVECCNVILEMPEVIVQYNESILDRFVSVAKQASQSLQEMLKGALATLAKNEPEENSGKTN